MSVVVTIANNSLYNYVSTIVVLSWLIPSYSPHCVHMCEYIAGRYVGTWTYVDCMPVTDTYIGGQTGFVHWRYLQCMIVNYFPAWFVGHSNPLANFKHYVFCSSQARGWVYIFIHRWKDSNIWPLGSHCYFFLISQFLRPHIGNWRSWCLYSTWRVSLVTDMKANQYILWNVVCLSLIVYIYIVCRRGYVRAQKCVRIRT